MSKVRLTATIPCFQIGKNGRKSLSFTVRVSWLFYPIPREIQQRRRSASAPAQFYQLSLESMIAKPATCKKIKNKIPVRHACADPDNSNGGGLGDRIASRRRFVPVFILGNKWQLMIFMGRSGPPAPSVSAHIRVSNSLNSHFILFYFKIFFAGPGQFTKRLLIISADAKARKKIQYCILLLG